MPAVPFSGVCSQSGAPPDATNSEIVRVTARTSDTLTIVRAQEGTSARSIGIGDYFVAGVTKKTLTDLENYKGEWDAYYDFGMVPDLRTVYELTSSGTQQVIANGGTTVTIPNAVATLGVGFTDTATDGGKRITIQGAGASGGVYVGTIVSVTNSSTAVVTPAANTTVTASTTTFWFVQWGTDNTTAIGVMQTAINAQTFPCPKIRFGKYNNSDFTGAWGWPVAVGFNKVVWLDGMGGSHTTDVGDYTKMGGTRQAWWGTSSDGGTNFGAMITVSPTGTTAIKRPRISNMWFDGRNGDANQALYLLKIASGHGFMMDNAFFMDAAAQALWMNIATSPTEAKDSTRFDMSRLCFRQIDNTLNATTTATTVTAVTAAGLLTNVTPINITVTSATGYGGPTGTGSGYAIVNTTSGRRHVIRYASVSGSVLTNCIISTEEVIHTPTVYVNAFIAPCQPGLGGAMKLDGGSGANTSIGKITSAQISFGETWGLPALDLGNTDTIDFDNVVMNGGNNTTEANGNRQRRPGAMVHGSIVNATLASRNVTFRNCDMGGAPTGPKGGLSCMGVTNAGAVMGFPSGPTYADLMQMGNGMPVPIVELGAFFDWNGNGMWRVGQINNPSYANQVLTAATDTVITGTGIVVPPQGWQQGTHLRYRIPIRKTTAVGTGTITVKIRQHSSLTAGGGTAIMTQGFITTAAIDAGYIEIDLFCDSIATPSAATAKALITMMHSLVSTGLAATATPATVPATSTSGQAIQTPGNATPPTMATFNALAAAAGPTFLFLEINSGTGNAVTVDFPCTVECVHPASP